MQETDLHGPIKAFFEQQGYSVQAEVLHCDLVAVRGDELTIIELKTSLNLTLVVQAVSRQKLSHQVFVAVPEPRRTNAHFKGTKKVLARLGIGLLVVRSNKMGVSVRLLLAPGVSEERLNKKAQAAVLAEVTNRTGDYNIAGSTRTTLITAYRECALLIGSLLTLLGPTSPARLRALGTGAKTRAILADNHYGWFRRAARGIYEISPDGVTAVHAYPEFQARAKEILLIPPLDP